MHAVYDQFFHHQDSDAPTVDLQVQIEQVQAGFDAQRNRFRQVISAQRPLVENASREPSLWWFNSNFSATRYETLVEQQIDIFRIFHDIDAAVSE